VLACTAVSVGKRIRQHKSVSISGRIGVSRCGWYLRATLVSAEWTLILVARVLQKCSGVLEEGIASVAKTGEQLSSPLLHHVKGELLLAQNPSHGAEAELCFRTAIEISRRQSARSIERHDEPRPAAKRAGPS
jgi:hypothetical protein